MDPRTPDSSALLQEPLAERPFPGGPTPALRMVFRPEVHAAVWGHVRATPTLEVCGVLVGTFSRDKFGPFAEVEASIVGEGAAQSGTEVTFTHETWNRINREMDAAHAGRRILGWYHSHPDFGVFLSERDRFIHDNFFSHPGQVAHVLDPVRNSEGVFAWSNGEPTLMPAFWVGPDPRPSVAAGREPALPASAAPSPIGPIQAAQTSSEERAKFWLTGVLVVALLMSVLFLAYQGGLRTAERATPVELERQYQRGLSRAVFLKLRPDLRPTLDAITADLVAAREALKGLVEAGITDDDAKKQAAEQLASLGQLAGLIQRVADMYALTPQEEQGLRQILNGPGKGDKP